MVSFVGQQVTCGKAPGSLNSMAAPQGIANDEPDEPSTLTVNKQHDDIVPLPTTAVSLRDLLPNRPALTSYALDDYGTIVSASKAMLAHRVRHSSRRLARIFRRPARRQTHLRSRISELATGFFLAAAGCRDRVPAVTAAPNIEIWPCLPEKSRFRNANLAIPLRILDAV